MEFSCPLSTGLFGTRLFYILNPQPSGEQWGYMVPSAPADRLVAQTGGKRHGRGDRGNSEERLTERQTGLLEEATSFY